MTKDKNTCPRFF